eukprot:1150573-Pelagomonas_calceolata.AAC.13
MSVSMRITRDCLLASVVSRQEDMRNYIANDAAVWSCYIALAHGVSRPGACASASKQREGRQQCQATLSIAPLTIRHALHQVDANTF